MRLLLDTHVLLWWLGDTEALDPRHRELIAAGRDEVFVSSISVAEISIKMRLGKLDAPDGLLDALEGEGFTELRFGHSHAQALRDLPDHHRDPFDRMLIAQAQVDQLTFLTSDERCKQYDIAVA